MTANVPSVQHGKPWPIDNLKAPNGLETRKYPVIDIKPTALGTLDPPVNPIKTEDFMKLIRYSIQEASRDFP